MVKKIFLLSSERSGSNLIRTLIGKHPEIEAPVPPHLFNVLYKNINLYGDLSKSSNAKRLLADGLKITNLPYHKWNLNSSPEQIFDQFQPHSLPECIDAIYQTKAAQEGKRHYFSKGIENFHYAHFIQGFLEDVYFIYLHRDPRDVTASWMRTPLFMHTPYDVAKNWNKEQSTCIATESIYKSKTFRLSYEHLLADPVGVMTRLQEFLGVSVSDACFSTDDKNKESQRNPFWKNLSKPIMQQNIKKYKTALSRKDIRVIESITKSNMLALGYDDFDTDATWSNEKKLWFKVKQNVRRRNVKRKSRRFLEDKMKDLLEKKKIKTELRQALIKENRS